MTAAARASRRVKLKSVEIISWHKYPQADVQELKKHVSRAECGAGVDGASGDGDGGFCATSGASRCPSSRHPLGKSSKDYVSRTVWLRGEGKPRFHNAIRNDWRLFVSTCRTVAGIVHKRRMDVVFRVWDAPDDEEMDSKKFLSKLREEGRAELVEKLGEKVVHCSDR